MDTKTLVSNLNSGHWLLGSPMRLTEAYVQAHGGNDSRRVVKATLSDDGKFLHLEFTGIESQIFYVGDGITVAPSCITFTSPVDGLKPHDEILEIFRQHPELPISFVSPHGRRNNVHLQQAIAG